MKITVGFYFVGGATRTENIEHENIDSLKKEIYATKD